MKEWVIAFFDISRPANQLQQDGPDLTAASKVVKKVIDTVKIIFLFMQNAKIKLQLNEKFAKRKHLTTQFIPILR